MRNAGYQNYDARIKLQKLFLRGHIGTDSLDKACKLYDLDYAQTMNLSES